jgi:hypothetical protein
MSEMRGRFITKQFLLHLMPKDSGFPSFPILRCLAFLCSGGKASINQIYFYHAEKEFPGLTSDKVRSNRVGWLYSPVFTVL